MKKRAWERDGVRILALISDTFVIFWLVLVQTPSCPSQASVPPSAPTSWAVGAPLPHPSAEDPAWFPCPGNRLSRTNLTDRQWKCWRVILSAVSLRCSGDMVTSPCVMQKKLELCLIFFKWLMLYLWMCSLFFKISSLLLDYLRFICYWAIGVNFLSDPSIPLEI